MKIACLMPTYNRCPKNQHLIEEALHSFLLQDYDNRELIICNDTPNQKLIYEDDIDQDKVIIQNLDTRFDTLSDKIKFMIESSDADLFCRWDDDDISLPHRLSYSLYNLGNKLEWRAENYYYCPGDKTLHTSGVGNTHCMSLWRREVLEVIGGYPEKASGWEDQQFNIQLANSGVNTSGDLVPIDQIFYLYRWGVSDRHLSGAGGGNEGLQNHWDRIGEQDISQGEFYLQPHWAEDYVLRAKEARGSAPMAG